MKKLWRHQTFKDWLLYTGGFILLACAIFITMFGAHQSFIWEHDGLTQHFVFLHNFNEIIRNFFAHPGHGFSTFSFNMGLGQDIIGQYSSYILGDPFAYLSLLFPMAKLELAYTILVLVRMYFVGLAFMAFAKYMKLNPKNIVIGALIYTFSSFILYAGVRHPYFLNAVILFPLLLIGMERLLKEGKALFLTLLSFVALVVNFYFFYMLAVLAALYGLIKFLFEYKETGIRHFFRLAGKLVVSYATAILMAGIVFLPILYTFFNSGRIEPVVMLRYTLSYYGALVNGLVTSQGANWNIYGVSALILLMLPLLFRHMKQYKTIAAYTLALLLISLVPQLGSFMNGFSYPSDRWIFAFSFMLTYTIVLFLDPEFHYDRMDKKLMIFTLAGYAALVITGNLLGNPKGMRESLAMLLLALAMFLVIVSHQKIRKIINPGIVLTALIVINLYLLGGFLFAPYSTGSYGSQFLKFGVAETDYNTMKGTIPGLSKALAVTAADAGLHRTVESPCSLYNLPLYFNEKSIGDYLSIGSKYEVILSKELANREYFVSKPIGTFDNRTKITTLLGIKYDITNEKNKDTAPYGFALIKTLKDPKTGAKTYIYENRYHLGLSAFYDTCTPVKEYDKLPPLEKEDSLLHTAALARNPGNIAIAKGHEKKAGANIDYTIKDPDRLLQSANTAVVKKAGQSITLNARPIQNSEIYVLIKGLSYRPPKTGTPSTSNFAFLVTASRGSISKKNGSFNKTADPYYYENHYFLYNLGYAKNYSGPLKLKFGTKGTYTFSRIQVLAVSMQDYQTNITKLIRDNLKITKFKDGFIEGTISNARNGILQIATPYSKGWSAYVDGKKTTVINVNTAFIGIPLKAGIHQVQFVYTTPYGKAGLIASLIGLIIFLLLWYLRSYKRKPR